MKKKYTFLTRFIVRIRASILPMLVVVCLFALLFPERTLAEQITHTYAGSYAIEVQMSQSAPQADQPFTVLVLPQERRLHLSGQIVEMPVNGTDAANVSIPLVSQKNVLKGTLHIPVRGFWHLVLQVNGPRGSGSATIPVVVTAPGAMPIWLAWSIGSLPALGLLWWIIRQRKYQRVLRSK
jgi:hypothetical protein